MDLGCCAPVQWRIQNFWKWRVPTYYLACVTCTYAPIGSADAYSIGDRKQAAISQLNFNTSRRYMFLLIRSLNIERDRVWTIFYLWQLIFDAIDSTVFTNLVSSPPGIKTDQF